MNVYELIYNASELTSENLIGFKSNEEFEKSIVHLILL